jgi:hypothetical protein
VNHEYVIAGDFNTNLDSNDVVAGFINSFCVAHSLIRCDNVFPPSNTATYVNEALNQQSTIDYILTSTSSSICSYEVIEPDINFSDHLPIFGTFLNITRNSDYSEHLGLSIKHKTVAPTQLRWDHADSISFYEFTRCNLLPVLDRLTSLQYDKQKLKDDVNNHIDDIYNSIVAVLTSGANLYVPRHQKIFYKFWWDQELDLLKSASIDSNRLWKAAGKPRHGPIFDKRQNCRAQYRRKIRESQRINDISYSNDLHEALLNKHGSEFWKCWRSKFEQSSKCDEVEGCVTVNAISAKFHEHFAKLYATTNLTRATDLHNAYSNQRSIYKGFPIVSANLIDTELVSNIIDNLGQFLNTVS